LSGAAETVEAEAENMVATSTTSEKDVEDRAPKTRGTYYFSQEEVDSGSTDLQAGTSVSTVEEVMDLKTAEETSAEKDDNIESPIAVSDVKPRRGGNFLSRNKWCHLAGAVVVGAGCVLILNNNKTTSSNFYNPGPVRVADTNYATSGECKSIQEPPGKRPLVKFCMPPGSA
jgi:hypothetical protein